MNVLSSRAMLRGDLPSNVIPAPYLVRGKLLVGRDLLC
jgi:hypothetical protein